MIGLKCSFMVSGEKICYLLDALHDKKICVYDLKFEKKGVKITLDYKDCGKFFAICSRLCYNVKRTGYKGFGAPLKFIVEKWGVAVGILAFFAFSFFFDGIIVGVRYGGEGEELAPVVESVLKEENAFVFGTLDDKKAKEAESKITLSSERVKFASVSRSGHWLVVDVRLASPKPIPLDIKQERILSPADGIVGEIVCLSGMPLVKEGDEVKKGDVLIDGRYVHGEKEGVTYALGEAMILNPVEYVYFGVGEESKISSRARTLAITEFGDGFFVDSVTFEEIDGKTACVVKGKKPVYTY